MTGMGGGSSNGSSIVSAFQSALLHQWVIILALFAVLTIIWNLIRVLQLRRDALNGQRHDLPVIPAFSEAPARRFIRLAFGGLWLLDGLLQLQTAMPSSLANDAIKQSSATSPRWVQDLVEVGVTIWNRHPITAATASVWIQIGIGLWLLIANRGIWSQAAGLVSVLWSLTVWSFGESFGGIFAPGLSWLFGAPGAVVFYLVAGILIALPETQWTKATIGLWTLRGLGAFTLLMGVVQALPGRGFWQGGRTASSGPGSLVQMVQSMATISQPHPLQQAVRRFVSIDSSLGPVINLVVSVSLIVLGLSYLSAARKGGRTRSLFGHLPLLPFVIFNLLLCGAVWVFIQDLGVFGGIATDPNSMLPIATLTLGGYLALSHLAETNTEIVPLSPRPLRVSVSRIVDFVEREPTRSLRSFGAAGALFVTLFGAIPIASASLNRSADPIIAESVDGAPIAWNSPAAPFSLTDQAGRQVSLDTLRGKTVVLTFLDPVCVSDCPIIAQELRRADLELGGSAKNVAFVAIDANPIYRAQSYSQAFSQQEGLNHLSNWHFLTGSLSDLQGLWTHYGVEVSTVRNGSMVSHSDIFYIIGSDGRIRYVINSDPGEGTDITQSSFATILLSTIDRVSK